jgi:hypothetical protein
VAGLYKFTVTESAKYRHNEAQCIIATSHLHLQYLASFSLNQAGSVLYFVALADAQISLAVPVANSLTFIFTGLMGSLLGERFGSTRMSWRGLCTYDAHYMLLL